MNIDTILTTLDTIGHYGTILSVEESVVLYNSLLLLQNENHFRKIYFWGKISGADKDYYIAYGYVKDALMGKIYYYSTNCTDWGRLPQPTEYAKSLCAFCTTQFQGDPSIVIDILIDAGETFLDKPLSTPLVRQLKEEDRLSATIFHINEEAVPAPRGALFKRPDGIVVENLNFQGLSELDAQEIKCYLHFRPPHEKWNTNLLTRVDYNYALDFLDSVDMDVPEGCWSIQLVAGNTLIILKSIYWPGMVSYHYVETPMYGFVYFGDGKKILDLPFMLNPM